MDKDKLNQMDDHFDQVMRLSRVYYVSLSNMEKEGIKITEDQLAVKRIAMSYCMLYEKHTGVSVWDLKNTGFADDIKTVAEFAEEQNKDG